VTHYWIDEARVRRAAAAFAEVLAGERAR
jgi:hypothetical protein